MTEDENTEEGMSLEALLLSRIYDVLMASYKSTDPEGAKRLYALHASGGLGNPVPAVDPTKLLMD